MPSPRRTVLDGLEGLCGAAEKEWRAANAQRERAVTRVVDAAKAKAADVGARVRDSRAVKVVDALFGERTDTRPEAGPVNLPVVNDRVRRTSNDVRRTREVARASGSVAAQALAWPTAAIHWVNRVRPYGYWDDKNQHPDDPVELYERHGNFSYGATAAALGVPEEIALRGAGAMQRFQAVQDVLAGIRPRERAGGFAAPYGDDPRDQGPISEGYRYGRRLTGR